MGEYSFPSYGRVAIVDDKREDVEIIQRVFAENGIPYIFYFFPDLQEVEIVKTDGIRLLFLDVELQPGLDETSKLTLLLRTVGRIIPPQNGPYAIILWTSDLGMTDKAANFFKKLDETESTKPSFVGVIEKSEFMHGSTKCLLDKMNEFYKDQNMLAFLMEIENVVMSVPSNVMKLFTYSFLSEASNEKLENMFLRLALTEKGNCDSSMNATNTILRLIADLVRDRYIGIVSESATINSLKDFWSFDFTDASKIEQMDLGNSVEQAAVINSALNINLHANGDERVAGKVYLHKNEETLMFGNDALKESTFNDINKIGFKNYGITFDLDLKPIEIDITSCCDYAQGNNHILQTVFGYIAYIRKDKSDEWPKIDYKGKIEHQVSRYAYVSPMFKVDEQYFFIIVNSKFKYLEKHEFSDKLEYLFQLNDEITNEIRKQTGETISRLGIACVSTEK